jgi:uncharacterized damage-inducible protein DinB
MLLETMILDSLGPNDGLRSGLNAKYAKQLVPCSSTSGQAKWLEGQSHDLLAERVKFPYDMTPPAKTRFEMLLGTKEHEMHHRGQLMLIERMLGIVLHLTRHMQERMAMASTVPVR